MADEQAGQRQKSVQGRREATLDPFFVPLGKWKRFWMRSGRSLKTPVGTRSSAGNGRGGQLRRKGKSTNDLRPSGEGDEGDAFVLWQKCEPSMIPAWMGKKSCMDNGCSVHHWGVRSQFSHRPERTTMYRYLAACVKGWVSFRPMSSPPQCRHGSSSQLRAHVSGNAQVTSAGRSVGLACLARNKSKMQPPRSGRLCWRFNKRKGLWACLCGQGKAL
jgi:hypothetical protein